MEISSVSSFFFDIVQQSELLSTVGCSLNGSLKALLELMKIPFTKQHKMLQVLKNVSFSIVNFSIVYLLHTGESEQHYYCVSHPFLLLAFFCIRFTFCENGLQVNSSDCNSSYCFQRSKILKKRQHKIKLVPPFWEQIEWNIKASRADTWIRPCKKRENSMWKEPATE